jgi:zinc/manganese transport system substrate-binding protein
VPRTHRAAASSFVAATSTFVLGALCAWTAPAFGAVEVVTTLDAYAAIAREVGGERVHVASISRSDEDAHFVKPKPSFALMLKGADLFVDTGLDLELWAPVLIDKSGNRRIRSGEPGYVNASHGVVLADVPAAADRSAGDVHLYGNPHLVTSPINVKTIAANVAAGLDRVDPAGAATYAARLADFQRRVDVALYGEELLEVLGSDVLDPLARQGKLVDFLRSQSLDGEPLLSRLGGWLGKALPLRGLEIVTYHRNWPYLTDLLGIRVVGYVELKPGIPPSARHVHELIGTIEQRRIPLLLAASYYSAQQVGAIAERTGCRAVRVNMGPSSAAGETYFDWFDATLDALLAAAGGGAR